ncbi:MAG TPA: hypothetical protein VMJ34_01335 [Bryobacteraceae bacterium]|nr:hypothetical protein [Bryobacteraceae bacterium]
MFFNRVKPKVLTFRERIDSLAAAGFTTQADASGGVRVSRGECAAVVKEGPDGMPDVGKAGIRMGGEIAELVSAGYQMFLMTRSGRKQPARADQLHALHDFTEDLREGLGLESLYNQGLGTTTARHLYDRVDERDVAGEKEAWRSVKADGVYNS